MFTYLTAGESHGKMLTAIIKKLPAGLPLSEAAINNELARRQCGYGRGGRMKIEQDRVGITSGVRHGLTLGSPVTLIIKNRDWENWEKAMSIEPLSYSEKEDGDSRAIIRSESNPRPGHADLAGAIKYRTWDVRNILERASARETAARTAVGAVCRQFLREFGIDVHSHVVQIGSVKAPTWYELPVGHIPAQLAQFMAQVESSPVRCGTPEREAEMIQLIDQWRANGDSLGGIFELIVAGLPIGLGSHVQWDERLDGQLAQALMSIQAIKGVEVGAGFEGAGWPGSRAHDEIYYRGEAGGTNSGVDAPRSSLFYRPTNYAGGLEGGMTNGEALIIRAAMKPIPTLANPLHSVDLLTRAETLASKERSDVCAVPAASIVGEAAVAIVLAQAFAAKFGGDSLSEMRANYEQYQNYVRDY